MAHDPTWLTERQAAIFDFLVQHIREHGYPPSVREIGKEFGIHSPNGVRCHTNALVAKGWIHITPNASRAIKILVGKTCECCEGLGRTGVEVPGSGRDISIENVEG